MLLSPDPQKLAQGVQPNTLMVSLGLCDIVLFVLLNKYLHVILAITKTPGKRKLQSCFRLNLLANDFFYFHFNIS